MGLANVRERLAALYGTQGRFALEAAAPTGARATLAIPYRGEAESPDAVTDDYRARADRAPHP